MKIGIIFGGKSAEHEVSCISAHSIYTHIDKTKFEIYLIGITKSGKFKHFTGNPESLLDCSWQEFTTTEIVDILGVNGKPGIYGDEVITFDCIFPILHGPYGEDGKIQGILEFAEIPYVGCGVTSSAISMDKCITKDLLEKAGINQTPHTVIRKGEELESILEKISILKLPLFVKPANMGSSVGITKVSNVDHLAVALELAFKYDKKILIEEGVNAREVEVGILGNYGDLFISDPGEIIVNDDFYDYDTKYKKATSETEIPAKLTIDQIKKIKAQAKIAYTALECDGLSRVDFFVEKNTGEIFLNEINTMPGFTSISMYPKLLEANGIKYSDIITKLIELATKRR